MREGIGRQAQLCTHGHSPNVIVVAVGDFDRFDLGGREDSRTDRTELRGHANITEHPTRAGKIYCCVVFDAFSRRVVVGRLTQPRPRCW
jgi:hypothetical protein